MSSLIEIQSQIEKLQKQADDIKTREFDKTVADILAKMNAFGITLKDLQSGKAGKSAKVTRRGAGKTGVSGAVQNVAGVKTKTKTKSRNAGTVVAPKFRGPNGEAWSGRGLMPRWLVALVAQGKTREDFAVKT